MCGRLIQHSQGLMGACTKSNMQPLWAATPTPSSPVCILFLHCENCKLWRRLGLAHCTLLIHIIDWFIIMEVHFSPFKKKCNSKNIQVPDLIVLDYSFNLIFFHNSRLYLYFKLSKISWIMFFVARNCVQWKYCYFLNLFHNSDEDFCTVLISMKKIS